MVSAIALTWLKKLTEKFKLLLYRFPIDWHNPIGYFFAVIWECIVGLSVLLFLGCVPLFAFGAFLFALAFAKDFKGDLRMINEMAKAKQPNVNVLKKLNEFVRCYSNVAQLSLLS